MIPRPLSAIVILLLAVCCTESADPVPYSYTHVLTGDSHKVWIIEGLFLRQGSQSEQRITLDACERDDQYYFYNNAERLFEVNNGNVKCANDEPTTLVSYNWAFNNGTATLTMVMPHIFGNFLIPFIVKRANNTDLELEIFLDEGNTISYVVYLKAIEVN